MRFAGIDLAGSPRNPTGVAVVETLGDRVVALLTDRVYSDGEIIDFLAEHSPRLVLVDAPLTWTEEGFREEERKLAALGYRPLSLKIPSMHRLMERGVLLASMVKCQETYAPALRDLISLDFSVYNEDERDALLCALTAFLAFRKRVINAGKVILPRTKYCLRDGVLEEC